jgi:hypothetical protein
VAVEVALRALPELLRPLLRFGGRRVRVCVWGGGGAAFKRALRRNRGIHMNPMGVCRRVLKSRGC